MIAVCAYSQFLYRSATNPPFNDTLSANRFKGGIRMNDFSTDVKLARAGDTEAFARLYSLVYKDLYHIALYSLRSSHDACDAVSDEVLLSHHYRCDPRIIGFNNRKYYNKKLKMDGNMVSDNPLGPFTHKGEVFKNIGNFFGTTGNNHHTIMKFKDQWYLFYHAQYLQDNMKLNGMGYRSTHIDKITMNSDGTMQQVKGTKTGVDQIKSLDPFTTVRAATFSHEGGIEITGSGNSLVKADKGDWFRVSGVDCKSAQTLTVKASSANGCVMKVCKGSASGTAVTYVEIPSGGSMQEITVPVVDLSGKTDLYFVFNNSASVDSWQLS